MYARQSPLKVMVSKLVPQGCYMSAEPLTAANWDAQAEAYVRYRFLVTPTVNVSAALWGDVDPGRVVMLDGLVHIDAESVGTWEDTRPLQEFLSLFPGPVRAAATTGASSGSRPSAKADTLLQQFPWLADFWPEHKPKPHRDEEAPIKDVEKDAEDGSIVPLADDEVEAVFAELDRRRAEVGAMPGAGDVEDFSVTVLGGAWTMAARGVAADAVQASARSPLAKDFCRRRGLPLSARFEISTYSQEHATVMARAWAHRMQLFLNVEIMSEDIAYEFTQQDKDEYVEPTELAATADHFPEGSRAHRRIEGIRMMFL